MNNGIPLASACGVMGIQWSNSKVTCVLVTTRSAMKLINTLYARCMYLVKLAFLQNGKFQFLLIII